MNTLSLCLAVSALVVATQASVIKREVPGFGGNYYRTSAEWQPANSVEVFSGAPAGQPAAKLWWGQSNSNPGSNGVGGGGLFNAWIDKMRNKFPFMNNFLSRMEVEPAYGAPLIRPAPNFSPIPAGAVVDSDSVIVSAPGENLVGGGSGAGGYDYPKPQYRLNLPQSNQNYHHRF